MRGRWLWAALLGAPMLVAAQTPLIEPSVAIGCLTPARDERGLPEYPFQAWKSDQAGRVQVELAFTVPDRQPDVKVLAHEGDDSFVDAVESHVKRFRLPCVTKGGPVARVQFDFVFKPDAKPVVAHGPTDPDHEAYLRRLECLRHLSGGQAPEYPNDARRQDIEGRIFLEMQFSAADRPPKATVYSSDQRGTLHNAVAGWAQGYRMPCYQGTDPVSVELTFVYLLDGNGGYGFKPLTLSQFLGAVRDIRKQKLDFDFRQMGCPFDVRLTYLQPHRDNRVEELENYHPARRPFVAWLEKAQLDLTASLRRSVYADHVTLNIPCAKLDLNPEG